MLPPVQPFREIDVQDTALKHAIPVFFRPIPPIGLATSIATVIYQLSKSNKDERR